MKRQADPLTKSGLVGAFCRTYSVQDAIEKFLPDVYQHSGHGMGALTTSLPFPSGRRDLRGQVAI